jgi:hypothetical protein
MDKTEIPKLRAILGTRLLVKQCVAETEFPVEGTNIVIHAPDRNEDATNICIVAGVGTGCRAGLKPGDYVLLPETSATSTLWQMYWDKYTYICDEEDVIAQVWPDEAA